MRVTLLFTDIEGSTALLENAGEIYKAALRRHHAIIRAEIERFGGQEFHEAGDGFCLAFENPDAAADCAIALQQVLTREPWPAETGALRVRTALHIGEADFLDGQYRGLAMNRAARILASSHGGQILCSGAVAEALGSPSRFELRDLGTYQLRGIREPERLFQICAENLPRTDFPPLAATPANRHNLPTQLTQFFGREKEIARLTSMLSPAAKAAPAERVITLTGPGGTGKTRLSVAVAERLLEPFSHAVTFVPLADVSAPASLADVVRDAMKIQPEPERKSLDQIAEALAAQPSLLVLDNFEQLAAEGGEFILALLRRTPTLRCLVSSRQRLAISGEREFPVPPLPVPEENEQLERLRENECASLFINRAQMVRGDFELTPKNAPAVAAVCRLLEGIPLAIELAAARVQILAPRQIFEQIRERVTALSDESGTRPERHRTLHAAIEWSYQSLPAEVQPFFARLSVFRGGCSADAAAEICDAQPVSLAVNHLLHLRMTSLIFAEEGTETMRYRMLETIRQFAAEHLGVDADATCARHFEFFNRMAREADTALKTAAAGEWLSRLDTEADNLRAALSAAPDAAARVRMAYALRNYWDQRGLFTDTLRFLDFDESERENLPGRLFALALTLRGQLHWQLGELDRARADYGAALTWFREQNDIRSAAAVLSNLAGMDGTAGDYEAALRRQQEGATLLRQHGSPRQLSQVLGNLGITLSRLKDFESARACYEESLALSRAANDEQCVTDTLGGIAGLHLEQRNFLDALRFSAEALASASASGNRPGMRRIYALLADILAHTARPEDGVMFYRAVERLGEEMNIRLTPFDQKEWDATLEMLKNQLDPAAFATAWERGGALTPEAALALVEKALQALHTV